MYTFYSIVIYGVTGPAKLTKFLVNVGILPLLMRPLALRYVNSFRNASAID